MTAAPTPARIAIALLTGVATTAYYATPDLIRSRTARGWTKAGIAALLTASSIPEFRRGRAAARERWEREESRTPAQLLAEVPASRKAAGAGAAALLLGGSVALTVAGERWMYRRGERRAAVGVAWAHTRGGVLAGLLAGALALIPADTDRPPAV
ncbi:hypothetical protein [Cellulomonas marina]|uniref:Peptidase S9 n=1 Tax=Cellulomonas marina TaxID=988821 RepID=A0A1I1ALQ6_9CELL|nr:hypothetical protein [Cellulomonas marina]GIG30461.1 hypothetical protein Cma02nite_30610 [Cellulomonas marina]SFB38965.1 hypothetical protein SAMN05421867_1205 [Cellulomonas marina]